MIRKRRSLGSCFWTRRKVHWRNLRLSRSAYVLNAKRRSLEARRYSEEKTSLNYEDEGKSTKSLSKMITIGSDSTSGTKVDIELQFTDVSVQQKTGSTPEPSVRASQLKNNRQNIFEKRLLCFFLLKYLSGSSDSTSVHPS